MRLEPPAIGPPKQETRMPRHNQQCTVCQWKVFNSDIPAGINPPCPNCGGATERNWMGYGTQAHSDTIVGGMWLENYGPKPIFVESHTERERVMKERGLSLKEKFCPLPGTDIDPQGIPNPKGYMDAQTLANATELICRNGARSTEDENKVEGVLVDMQVGTITERDAIAISSGDPRRQSRLHRRMTRGSS